MIKYVNNKVLQHTSRRIDYSIVVKEIMLKKQKFANVTEKFSESHSIFTVFVILLQRLFKKNNFNKKSPKTSLNSLKKINKLKTTCDIVAVKCKKSFGSVFDTL